MSETVLTQPAPSPPSKPRKSKEIQAALIEALESRRRIYGAPCIATLADLLEEIGEDKEARGKEVSAAISGRTLGQRIFVPVTSKSATKTCRLLCPICHIDDLDQFLQSEEFLRFVFEVRELEKRGRGYQIKDLVIARVLRSGSHKDFRRVLNDMIKSDSLPPWIGCIPMVRGVCLFVLDAVRNYPSGNLDEPGIAPVEQPTSPAATSPDFSRDFEDAFTQIDREDGLRNFVKLSDLRHALPHYSRQEFDSGLNDLRRARRFTLNSSDGNHVKVSAAEREAAITEAGSVLVYCSRRNGDR